MPRGIPTNIKLLLGLFFVVGSLLLVQKASLQREPDATTVVRRNNTFLNENGNHDHSSLASNTIINTTTTTRSPRIYLCGHDLWNFYKGIFPDLEFGGRLETTSILASSTKEDVLLFVGMDGPCAVSFNEIQSTFAGKILFVNGEPRKGGASEKQRLSTRFYKLGPSEHDETEPRTLPIYFGTIFWYASTTSKQQQAWLLDPSLKHQSENNNPRDAVVFVASNCLPLRREAASEISKIVEVHHGPKCRPSPPNNNNTQRIPKQDWTGRNSYTENWKLYSKYKYCLVMENTKTVGYITEKIVLAFLGGCLPIYWGTEEIFDIFNPRSFIFYDIDNPQAALRELKQLQANASAYNAKTNEPILRNGNQTIDEYFSFAFDIGNGSLKWKIRHMLGLE
jgi:hypothetical protein